MPKPDVLPKFLLLLALLTLGWQAVVAQTSAFNYQGKLTDAGNPANGTYDMQFKLFNTDTVGTGTQQGATLTNPTVPVTAGSFSITLDFGANVFDGSARFLEISVRPAGGPNPYIVLSPRQPINSSPYAVNARQLGGLAADRYVASDTNGNIGIGTQTPTARLTVSGAGAANAPGAPRFDLFNTTADSGFVQHVTDSGLWQIASTTGATRMVIDPTGNVGIGSITPNTRLTLGGGVAWTAADWTASMNMLNGSAFGWEANASGQRFGIGQTGGGLYFFRTNSAFGNTGSPANYDMTITDMGNVGIGTSSPTSKVEIVAQDGLKITGFQPFMTLLDTNTGLRSLMAGGNGDFGFYPASFIGGVPAVLIKNGTGNVGIGTSSPEQQMHVHGNNILSTGPFAGFAFRNRGSPTNADDWVLYSQGNIARLFRQNVGDVLTVTATGQVSTRSNIFVDGAIFFTAYAGIGGTVLCYNESSNGLVQCSSSLRYKTDLRPFFGGLNIVNRLRPITYKWKTDGSPDVGFGAEDVAEIEPLLITRNKKGEIQGVKYERLSVVFVNAIKEQQSQIEQQSRQLRKQQTQIERQQREIGELRQAVKALILCRYKKEVSARRPPAYKETKIKMGEPKCLLKNCWSFGKK